MLMGFFLCYFLTGIFIYIAGCCQEILMGRKLDVKAILVLLVIIFLWPWFVWDTMMDIVE